MKTIKIRPGYIVCLTVKTVGGLRRRQSNRTRVITARGSQLDRYDGECEIENPEERDAADTLRSGIRNKIRAACYQTPFGLVSPLANEGKLNDAIADGRDKCDAWNAKSETADVRMYVLKGKVAASDEEAAEAIADECRGILAEMERACQAGSVAKIRKAADRARNLGQMVEGESDAGAKLTEAIKAARSVARQIVKRVEKGSEEAEAVIAELSLEPIQSARFAFGDGDAIEVEGELPQVAPQRFAGIDLAGGWDEGEVAPAATPEPVEPSAGGWDEVGITREQLEELKAAAGGQLSLAEVEVTEPAPAPVPAPTPAEPVTLTLEEQIALAKAEAEAAVATPAATLTPWDLGEE